MMKRDYSSRDYANEQVQSKLRDKELILRLLRYLKPYFPLLIVAILLLVVSKIIESLVPIFVGKLSQKILDSASLDIFNKEQVFSYVLKDGLWILSLLLFSYIFDSVNVVIKSWIGQKGLYTLRMETYQHTLKLPLSYFDKNTIGRLMTRTIHDIDQINQMFAESVIPIIGSLILFACIFIGIIFIDWRIAVMVVVILPFVWWLTHHFRYYQRRCYDRIRTIVAAMNTFVQEQLMGVSIVRNFGLQKQSKDVFEEINNDHCDAYIESIHHFGFFMAGIDLLQNLTLISAFAVMIIFSPFGSQFDAGTFFTFSLYALMFFRPLADLAERYNVLQAAMAAASRVFNLIDTPTEPYQHSAYATLERIDSIAFEDVWFAYEDEHWILKGLSMTIHKGESCALVGMTGEGKSTILSLLLRFYDYQKGSIKINGVDIRKYSLESIRKQFSPVLQDPVLFSGTIAQNIALFNPAIERSIIQQVISNLGLQTIMQRFPQGIDYFMHERGQGLSTGEMQIISLARAMVYHRSMLILDEATSNIDSLTESIIQQALKKILGSTTALVIAHRLSTIKDVNRILVLQDGKIAEEGKHKFLLEKQGIYEKLYRLQYVQ